MWAEWLRNYGHSVSVNVHVKIDECILALLPQLQYIAPNNNIKMIFVQ